MGEHNTNRLLSKERRKRLDSLEKSWEAPEKLKRTFGAADLRLLLEHYRPLRELIRSISMDSSVSPKSPVSNAYEHQTAEASTTIQADLGETQQELTYLRQHCNSLEQEIALCKSRAEKLTQQNATQQQANQQLEHQLRQLRVELAASKEQLAQATRCPPELATLREDAWLAQQLGLAELPADNLQALVQIVAVLAQLDNLERLWNALKERCEAENRAVNPAERALLGQALGWYNHNWHSKPYRLIEATAGAPYDYEQHSRSKHFSSGETISELRLPGFADGSGRPRCKALVITR